MPREYSFNKGHDTPLTFPFTQATMDNLGPTSLVSPRVGNAHGYANPNTPEEMHLEMEDVERVRYEVNKNQWPGWWLSKHGVDPVLSPIIKQTLRLSESGPKACANIVRMDHPFEIWDNVIEPWAHSQNIAWDVPAAHQGVTFVEQTLRRAQAHVIIAAALDKSFDVKYYYGQPRPFEYSEYDEGLEFYPCPAHPEKPAGHGAFCGGGAKAFEQLFVPSAEQIQMVHTATKQFAMFRTFSGMHIASSNLLGWTIGYES